MWLKKSATKRRSLGGSSLCPKWKYWGVRATRCTECAWTRSWYLHLIQSAGYQMMASKRWHTGTKTSGGQKLCIRRHNQQFFITKATLGPVRQIIDNWLIRFGDILSIWYTFKEQIGSVAVLVSPSSSPGWYKYLTTGRSFFRSIQQAWNTLLTGLRRLLFLWLQQWAFYHWD